MSCLSTQRRGRQRLGKGVGLIRDGGRRRGDNKARDGAVQCSERFVNFSTVDRPRDRVRSQWI